LLQLFNNNLIDQSTTQRQITNYQSFDVNTFETSQIRYGYIFTSGRKSTAFPASYTQAVVAPPVVTNSGKQVSPNVRF